MGGDGGEFPKASYSQEALNSASRPNEVERGPDAPMTGLTAGLGWANQPVRGDEAHRGLKHQQCAQCSPGLVWPPLAACLPPHWSGKVAEGRRGH